MSADDRKRQRDRQWFIVGRWHEFEGEGRANFVRIAAIGSFYSVQLIQHYLVLDQATDQDQVFHRAATWIAVAWTVMALTILLCLRGRIFPGYLKFLSTAGDLTLLTAVAAIGAKAHSPIVFGLFVIIGLAALRFSLPLVWFATLGAMTSFMALVGATDQKWFDVNHDVAIHVQLIILLSIGLTGIVAGQMIRQTRKMASEYLERIQSFSDSPMNR